MDLSGTGCQGTGSGIRRGVDLLGTGLWLLLGLGPILAILVAATGNSDIADVAAPSLRRLDLFLTSIALGAAVASFTTAVSVLAAYAAGRHAGRPAGLLFWAPLSMIAVPPYVHANAWMAVGREINTLLGRAGGAALAVPDWAAAFWVQSMAFLPVTFGFALLGMARVEPALADAGLLHGDRWRVFTRISLPLAAPLIVVGTGLAALLSLIDFGTPALFQLPSYAMEIFVTFSAGADARSTLVLALPLVIVCVTILAGLLGRIETGAIRPVSAGHTATACGAEPVWFVSLQRVAIGFLTVQLAVPLLVLIYETGSFTVFLETATAARADLGNSAATAAAAAALSLALGGLLFRRLHRRRWMLLCLVPLAIPGTLIGIGLINLWNREISAAVYGGPAMPVLASVARFAPIGIVLLYAYHKTIPRDLIDAARLFRGNGAATWRQVYLPLYWRGIAASCLLVFALSLGELAATILVLPPGQGALSIRVFNLLHYGSTSAVASLCLLMLLVSMAAGRALLLLLGRSDTRRPRRRRP